MRGEPKLVRLERKDGILKSPCWHIQYYDGKRSRTSATGCRIGAQDHEATIFLSQWILERERPTARKPDELMVAQALRDYYEEHGKHIATAKHALYHEKRLKVQFGTLFVSQVTQGKVNDYVRLCQGRQESNGTIRRDLEHLQAAFNHEVREQRLVYAPKFKKPSPPRARERFLTVAECDALITHCKSEHLKNFVKIMLATGQRPGAVEGLKWFQVDFKEKLIRFDKSTRQSTTKRARSVPINQELMSLLKRLFKSKETEYVLEYKGKHAGNVKKSFARAVDRAGLKGISRYTLRHTWGTHRYIEGHHEKDISDIMGHTTAKTTSKHYLHTQMDRLRNVVEGKSAEKVQKSKKRKNRNAR